MSGISRCRGYKRISSFRLCDKEMLVRVLAGVARRHNVSRGTAWSGTKKHANEGKDSPPQQERALRQLARVNTPTGVIGLKLDCTPAAEQAKASEEGVSLKPANQSPY